jgi:hypothetical protein
MLGGCRHLLAGEEHAVYPEKCMVLPGCKPADKGSPLQMPNSGFAKNPYHNLQPISTNCWHKIACDFNGSCDTNKGSGTDGSSCELGYRLCKKIRPPKQQRMYQ